MGFFLQLKALLYRNFLLKKRNKTQLIQELLMPIYFVAILALIKGLNQPKTDDAVSKYPSYSLDDSRINVDVRKRLIAFPNTTDANTIMQQVVTLLGMNSTLKYSLYPDQKSAEEAYKADYQNILAGIAFHHIGSGGNVNYSLRTPYSAIITDSDFFTGLGQCRQNSGFQDNHDQCKANTYLFTGFSTIQRAVDTAIIRHATNKMNFPVPAISVEIMAKDVYTPSVLYIQILSSMYFVLAYSPFINFLTVNLVAEKEKKIKEGMRMMGLRESAFWLSWSLIYAAIILVVTIVVAIIALVSQFFKHSSPVLFFIYLFLYGLTICNAAFMITPFFKKAQMAGVVAGFGTLIVSCLYLVVSLTRTVSTTGEQSYTIPPVGRWFFCLLSPVALALAMDQGIYLDIQGPGMNFDTLSTGEFPLYAPLIMLIVDYFLYFLLAVYLDNVIPGEFGPRQPPLFCFSPSYWFPRRRSLDETSHLIENQQGETVGEFQHSKQLVEPVSSEFKDKAMLKIYSLFKIFKGKEKPVRALDGLTLEMYEGQITALLGHNGAGKTTLINILSGLISPTRGTATVYGWDASNSSDIGEIRAMSGICPQQNILFDDLSCAEHLYVFANIKGVTKENVENQVAQALDDVGLKDQKDVFAKSLSGGQKRKLSVAIALIGNPKIIFLDEPTAGMDPYSRRHLWSLLKKRKQGKLILLTTHFMDEADILADRKAIISKGSLRCCGSSLFLKNRFGIGYHLNMVVDTDADTDKITTLLSEKSAGVEMKRKHGMEVSYTIPLSEVANFSDLFSALETQNSDGKTVAESLGILSYGVSMTTLEEVFLKLEEEMEDEKKESSNKKDEHKNAKTTVWNLSVGDTSAANNDVVVDFSPSPVNRNDSITEVKEDVTLKRQQFSALVRLRFLLAKRFKTVLVFQIILPVALVVAGCLINKLGQTTTDTSNPTPIDLTNTATKLYVRPAGFNYSRPLVVQDSQAFGSFIANLQTVYDTVEVNSSENLMNIAAHFVGVKIDELSNVTEGVDLNYTALYNDSAIHSLPVAMNIINNGLLAEALETSYSILISVQNWPWPGILGSLTYNGAAFGSVIMLGMAFIFIPPGFAMAVVIEKKEKIRGQLRVTGVDFSMYWGTFFVYSYTVFMIPAVACIIVVLAMQVDALSTGGAVFSLILLFVLYSPNCITAAYVCSFMFKKPETCQAVLPNLFFFIAFIPYLIVSLLDMLGNSNAANILHYLFVTFDPPYTILGGIYYIDRIYRVSKLFGQDNTVEFGDYFAWDNKILYPILVQFVHMFLLYYLLRILDVRSNGGTITDAIKSTKVSNSPKKLVKIVNEEEDDDVSEERNRVDMSINSDGEPPVALVCNLRKEFQKDKPTDRNCFKRTKESTTNVAVKDVSFMVTSGEVFGLLGPNGAGKTTTLNTMIAEVAPTRGKVALAGVDIQSSMTDAFQELGYCPQHDAVWPRITLEEHLHLYASLKGVSSKNRDSLANHFIENLQIQEHRDKHADKLSGGTKRKLSYAISMLNSPTVALLDEPSTGMDPQTKRFFWDTISQSFSGTKRGAVLTTHYMEEADALCSRVGIMVNGKLQCIGSTQHLKSKFGSGYLLEIKLSTQSVPENDVEDKMDALEKHIKELFPHATQQERFAERAQYKIPKEDLRSLSLSFKQLENAKENYFMEEYSFSQATLEQVFIEFAKKQEDEKTTS